MDEYKKLKWRYCRGIPRSIPDGRVLCHNQVMHGPETEPGCNGFRAWTCLAKPTGFKLCPCGWGGFKRHYALSGYVAAWRPGEKEWMP